MPAQARPSSEHGEEARAFLQARVTLFWKLMFFISLLSILVGALGLFTEPGLASLFDLAGGIVCGLLWQLCRRGERSIRYIRAVETGGLLFEVMLGAVLGRFLLAEFADTHALDGHEAAVMTDAFVSMFLLTGTSLLLVTWAAVIPSGPRRTSILTALAGIPLIVVSTVLVPDGDDWLAWRALDSSAYRWLPATLALMWSFVVVTCSTISWVIYGLRAEVREARRLGQYVLERKLGEGGMGEVYLARHGMMRRPTAIKLLPADRAGETNIRRFEREVQLTARLTHPNTITIFDYGRTADDVFYYAMEFLDGATLRQVVEIDGAQPAGRVVRILAMACGALEEAHGIGLIHRDIKPANIMLCTRGGELDVVKVLDFGLVKQVEVDRDVELTGTNTITGTPQYMAPESILSPDSVDARTDIYALGAVAYYLLAGTDVFDGKSVVEVCSQHLHQEPQPPSSRGVAVPADLEAVVLACLEKDPEGRPQSATELRQRIEACDVEPWDNARAAAWWREHRSDLDDASPTASIAEAKTIAVDRSRRSDPESAARAMP